MTDRAIAGVGDLGSPAPSDDRGANRDRQVPRACDAHRCVQDPCVIEQ